MSLPLLLLGPREEAAAAATLDEVIKNNTMDMHNIGDANSMFGL